MTEFWIGLGLGGGLGVLYHAASYFTYRRAARAEGAGFYQVFLGGLTLRLLGALLAFSLGMAFAPVEAGAYSASFLAVLAVGLVAEGVYMYRRGRQPQMTPASQADSE